MNLHDQPSTATGNQPHFEFETLPPRSPQRPHRSRGTSRAAYRDSLPRTKTKKRKVYDAIVIAGQHGQTRWELHRATGILYSSIPSITGSLIADGLVCEITATRPTANGGEAHVLVAASVIDGGAK